MYFAQIISILAMVAAAAAMNLPPPNHDHHSLAVATHVRDSQNVTDTFCWRSPETSIGLDKGNTSSCCQLAKATYDGKVST